MRTNFLTADWFNRPATEVAVDLLGCTFCRRINNETIEGTIVETEAYEAGDPAMYAYQRKTERNAVVFGPAGIAYVYRIYRQYHCFNIVTDKDGFASTILIRAVDLRRRPSWLPKKETAKPEKLNRVAAGPGKFCRALQIDTSLRGALIHPDAGLWIEPRPVTKSDSLDITQTTRIGLSKGVDIPRRWYLTASPAVSRR